MLLLNGVFLKRGFVSLLKRLKGLLFGWFFVVFIDIWGVKSVCVNMMFRVKDMKV